MAPVFKPIGNGYGNGYGYGYGYGNGYGYGYGYGYGTVSPNRLRRKKRKHQKSYGTTIKNARQGQLNLTRTKQNM